MCTEGGNTMDNMLRYLDWRGDLSFDTAPLCTADLLIFSELAHLPFEKLGKDAGILPLRLARGLLYSRPYSGSGLEKKRYELLCRAEETVRYLDVSLVCFEEYFSAPQPTQFCAALFRAGREGVIAFRGTDGTLIGWQEDLCMSFEDAVPSQKLAKQFLERCAREFSFPLNLTGHSKGGNLAMYACARAESAARERVKTVCAFDAPGLSETVLAEEGWKETEKKLSLYVPEASVIGLLLENPGKKTVVKSDSVGLLQHDPFNWHILGTEPVKADRLSLSARYIRHSVSSFLEDCPRSRRRLITEKLFEVLNASGAKRVSELPAALLLHSSDVMKVLGGLTEEEKKKLLRLVPGVNLLLKD